MLIWQGIIFPVGVQKVFPSSVLCSLSCLLMGMNTFLSPATIRTISLVFIVMAGHGTVDPVCQVLRGEELGLAGDVPVAWHVPHPVILLVVVNLLG